MTTLFAIIAQLVLAFFILSIIYLIVSFFLWQNFSGSRLREEIKSTPDFERHLALIFKDKITEEQLLAQVQWLLKQEYKNFSAYFFCSNEIVEYNGIQNIKIWDSTALSTKPKDILQLVKKHAQNLPSKIILVKSKSILPNDFLFRHNEALFDGTKTSSYSKCEIVLESNNKLEGVRSWISNQVESMKNLIESSDKKVIRPGANMNGSIHRALGILFACSILLSGINSLGYFNKSIFDYISFIGILAVTITAININLSKKWKTIDNRRILN